MSTISSAPVIATYPPLPPPVAGIDINFCKNPRCRNFGVPAEIVSHRRLAGTPLISTPGKAYKRFSRAKMRPKLECLLCGEAFGIKSNLAVAEEIERISAYLKPCTTPCCSTPGCPNGSIPAGTQDAYAPFGSTAAGTPRWRCRHCGKTFAVGGRALKRQRITHLNKTVLLSLTNKMPLRRICKVTGLSPEVLYGKMAFLHRQALAYAAARERALPELRLPELNISVDRQVYSINWNESKDRRNIVLRAVASADNESGYVFGINLAYDSSLDPKAVDAHAIAIGDPAVPYPHRRYARVWLKSDFADSLAEAAVETVRRRGRKKPEGASLEGDIHNSYEDVVAREDTEISDLKARHERLPENVAMQVHEEYTLYAHLFLLRRLLAGIDKFRVHMDQESGIRAAFMAAFHDLVMADRAEGFFVRIAKEQTVKEKAALVRKTQRLTREFHALQPQFTWDEARVEVMKISIAHAREMGPWGDPWCAHPWPTMSEPNKCVCWLTNRGNYDLDHQAQLYLKSSLAAVDNFFQRIRRSLNPLERAPKTASTVGRTWYGYSPYNPRTVETLLGIYRVMHNWVEVGEDGRTPAMRLGLATMPAKPEDIIYFEDSGATSRVAREASARRKARGPKPRRPWPGPRKLLGRSLTS